MIKRIGRVVSAPKGFAVVSMEGLQVKDVRQGLPVVDKDGVRVGYASDVIGNVRAPYVVVRVDPGAKVEVGEELFLVVQERRGRGRRRGRR